MIKLASLYMNAKYMLHGKKPKLVARAGYQYMKYFMGERPKLRYVDCILHYACNLKCVHCSCESLKNKTRRIMTPEEWGCVAKQAQELGAITFGIQGGEPLIYPHLEEVIRKIDPSKNYISIKTNGTIVSDEKYKQLKDWGVDSVTVGFGPVPNEYAFDDYNAISRKLNDAFSLSLKSIELLIKNDIKPMMSVVVSRNNIRSKVFLGVIELAKRHNCILNCALAVPVGCWEKDSDIMLRHEDRKELEKIIKKYPHVRTDFQSNWCVNGCGALKEKVYISPYGDVMPCPFIHISFGNVLREPLKEIWQRGITKKTFAEYPPVCIAAEDKEFLKYLDIATRKNTVLPLSYDEPEINRIITTKYSERILLNTIGNHE